LKSISDSVAGQDPRLLQSAREYLLALEAGERPDREKYLSLYPQLTKELTDCFDGVDLAHALRPAPASPDSLPVWGEKDEIDSSASPLGDFKIVREIGRGGMGIVYEAMQLSLGRRVALKVLPFASGLDSKHLQRFKTESSAAAQLHHTNIVPVHAVGYERGVHFYAMQLIEGRPLTAVIKEWRKERSKDVEEDDAKSTMKVQAPTTMHSSMRTSAQERERFQLATRIAVQVAEALQYAHDAGVVHRDIKPANLILDPKGTVWVMDFGLAQIATEMNLTQTGDILGTLRYTSPEQAGGKRLLIDHRTDIYSLGATLYELLTLEPVFAGLDRRTLLHEIFHNEPIAPRRIDKSIPFELETIVLKALAKRPSERYATAGEFAADLRRYLEHKPILARRPTLFDHVSKWIRRHPSIIVFLLILLTLGIAGLGVSTTLINHERDQQKLRAQEAEDRFQLARQSADEMIQIADEELGNFGPQQQTVRRRLLEAALAYYQELIKIRHDHPAAAAELQQRRDKIEAILADLAVIKGAERHLFLSEPPVQRDLELTADQKKRLEAIFQDIRKNNDDPARIERASRLRSDEKGQQVLREMKAHDAAIEAILTKDQLHRLDQIMIQKQGLGAFQDPRVIAELGLTREQRRQIREIGGMRPHRPGGGPEGPPPEHGKRPMDEGPPPFEGRGRAELERALKILTSEQQTLWRNLTGKPFMGRIDRGPP
jgi:serine/threonine protein kinase